MPRTIAQAGAIETIPSMGIPHHRSVLELSVADDVIVERMSAAASAGKGRSAAMSSPAHKKSKDGRKACATDEVIMCGLARTTASSGRRARTIAQAEAIETMGIRIDLFWRIA